MLLTLNSQKNPQRFQHLKPSRTSIYTNKSREFSRMPNHKRDTGKRRRLPQTFDCKQPYGQLNRILCSLYGQDPDHRGHLIWLGVAEFSVETWPLVQLQGGFGWRPHDDSLRNMTLCEQHQPDTIPVLRMAETQIIVQGGFLDIASKNSQYLYRLRHWVGRPRLGFNPGFSNPTLSCPLMMKHLLLFLAAWCTRLSTNLVHVLLFLFGMCQAKSDSDQSGTIGKKTCVSDSGKRHHTTSAALFGKGNVSVPNKHQG